MSEVLYRKYRAQRFSEIIGQDELVQTLQNAVAKGKVGHAYLFCGPRGTGKTSTARILAKSVNCLKLSKDGEPCNKCSSCEAIMDGRFIDLIEIDAASNRGIDEIRNLKERITFAPTEGKNKVYIIDEVHMLTREAFNALLKTLEEPPAHVILILCTTEPHKLPPTIISRCQRFDLKLASKGSIVEKLKRVCEGEEVEFDGEALDIIAAFARGSYRDAESILEKVMASVGVKTDKVVNREDVEKVLGLVDFKQVSSLLISLLSKNLSESITTFHKIVGEGIDLNQLVFQLLELSRQRLLTYVGGQEQGEGMIEERKNLLKVVRELSDAERGIKSAVVAELPIELAIFKICEGDEVIVTEDRAASDRDEPGKEGVVKVCIDKVKKVFPGKGNEKKRAKGNASRRRKAKLPLSKIKEKWLEVVEKTRPHNHHLSAFLRRAEVDNVGDDRIVLKVPFKFHKQRIEDPKACRIIAEVLEQVYGKTLKLHCQVCAGMESKGMSDKDGKNGKDSNVVADVLSDVLE